MLFSPNRLGIALPSLSIPHSRTISKIFILLIVFSMYSFSMNAQDIWQDAPSERIISPKKERLSQPTQFRTLSFDSGTFLNQLQEAPSRDQLGSGNGIVMGFPLPNGRYGQFEMVNAELMHPDLAAKFPELKNYIGKGIEDKTASVRVSYSPYFGLNVMIQSGKHSTVYIDPFTKDHQYYMAYYRKDITNPDTSFECFTEEPHPGTHHHVERHSRVGALGDCNLRRYRLAQSCTGEYAQYHISQAGGTTGTTAGDKAIVQAAMNVTMNRVNGVFENDMGITMQFIPNNDLIIYLNAATDPWSGEYNTTTAQTIDAQIGVANYDIGHNFNTSGGGNAGCLDCVCLAVSQNGTHKGRGYTGRAAPIGDPFDIDYVAHEMGHQYGGYHVQSNASCRSGSGATEVETGSGSSIMGYAGICTANVQNQSDDYFAYVNIRDIVTTANGGNASGCAELITSGNSGPSSDAGSDYSIPVSTPFKLEGTGSDPDDSGITYCWEQNDPENPSSNAAPTPTRTVGPMFRSLPPVSEPYRYMPNLDDLVNNVTPTFEVLPSVSRNMEFSFIVRDNNGIAGCTSSDLMNVTTVAGAGPFLVTSPNTNVTWDIGDTETITWDVAGTDIAPINCSNVDILLSQDGGMTYPVTLASNVANDGTHDIIVPNNLGNQTRIMIFCSDNIFFDISNEDFTIQTTTPTYIMTASPTALDLCPPATGDYVLDLEGFSGFSSSVNLSVSGLPSGATSSFSANNITPTASSTLTIDPGTAAIGSYTITVTANGGGITRTLDLALSISSTNLGAVSLNSPTDGATDEGVNTPLSWNAIPNAVSYEVEVATDMAFSNIVYTETGIPGTSTTASGLAISTTYYWRVRAVNDCLTDAWSSVWSYTTQSTPPCTTYAAGPYTDFGNAPCASACGIPYALGYEVWSSESYLVRNVNAGSEYTFEFCNGYNAATWAANITVAYYDGSAPTTDFFTTSGCTATFTTPMDGDIVLIVWSDPCGSASINTDNGIPTFQCTGNGTLPPACQTCLTEDFEAGQPDGWYFTNTWNFDNGSIGGGTTGANNGTGAWGYFDDDAAGNGSTDQAKAISPYFNLSNACNVTLSFDYTYREYNDANQEFVRMRVYDGTQWQYWDGTAWTTTATNWLDVTSEIGTFSETLPSGFLNGAFRVEFDYDDNGGWEYGFGIDNFSVSNDCAYLEQIPDGAAATYTADSEITVGNWTHYIDDAGTPADPCDDMLLLSVKKNGENIGTIGDGTFQCILRVDPTVSDLSSADYASNPDGWYTMNRYWNITPTNEPTSDVEVRFYYTEADFTGITAVASNVTAHEDMYFWKINDISPWNVDPTSGHTGVPFATGHAQDGYQQYANGGSASTTTWMRIPNWGGNSEWNAAEYTVGHFGGGGGGAGGATGQGALPVELVQFDGIHINDRWNELSWTTISEENSKTFEVQRATPQHPTFRTIGQVAAAGQSATSVDYGFKDTDYQLGHQYYRLKMIDWDESFSYSEIIDIHINEVQEIHISPNPNKGQFQLNFGQEVTGDLGISVFDATGKVMYQNEIQAQALTNQSIDLSHLSDGIYLIHIKIGNEYFIEKLIKYQ